MVKECVIGCFGEVDFELDEIQFLPKIVSTISSEKFLDLLTDMDDA
jgi:hypothetical protein